MDIEEDFDFTIVADNIFPQDDTNVNFLFDITWKDKSSKLIINCRETSRRGNHNEGIAKIKSFTIPELEAVHNELSTIEPKIMAYFPTTFTFKMIDIERPTETSSWNFFSRKPTSVVEPEREFSEDTVEAIKYYLRAVTEICGRKLLFSVIFKEDNIIYYEDPDVFIRNESIKKMEQCESLCNELLSCHIEIENLQSLTEDLYIKQDEAINNYYDSLYNDSLMVSLPLKEESENIKEQLEKVLVSIQVLGIGPKKITELLKDAETYIEQYYEIYRQILIIQIKLSKKKREMFFKHLTKMLEYKHKFSLIIFRDCAGDRMRRLSNDFHKENEKIAQFNLDFHSAKDIVVKRKVHLIQSWVAGRDMVRANVRHEDVSLIQLKHLDSSNMDTALIDKYYAYIKETYRLLLNYSESQRLSLENLKSTTDDPLHIVLPLSKQSKGRMPVKADVKDSFQSIDYSGVIHQESTDSEFEDALNEDEFGKIKRNEIELLQIKEDCERKLKEIANKRAELRNSKVKLETQYERLTNKASEASKSSLESLNLESLHPESHKSLKPVPGSALTPEQRKAEAKQARERIRKYQEKLRAIPEDRKMDNIKPKRKPPKVVDKPVTESLYVNGVPSLTTTQLPQRIPPPPPGPPPLSAPPPPPAPPPTIIPSHNSSVQLPKSKNKETPQQKDGNYLQELQKVFANKVNQRTIVSIDEELLARKASKGGQFNSTLSNMIDSRRQFYKSRSMDNSDNDDDDAT